MIAPRKTKRKLAPSKNRRKNKKMTDILHSIPSHLKEEALSIRDTKFFEKIIQGKNAHDIKHTMIKNDSSIARPARKRKKNFPFSRSKNK